MQLPITEALPRIERPATRICVSKLAYSWKQTLRATYHRYDD